MSEDPQFQKPTTDTFGEMTRFAMNLAGLDGRRRKNRAGLIIGVGLAVALVTVITLDLTGVVAIPGMGMVYDVTGVEDPQAERAVERYEARLANDGLSAQKRAAVRAALLGARKRAGESDAAAPSTRKAKARAPTTGVKDPDELGAADRAALASVFADTDKQEHSLALMEPQEIQTPNLPDGLTGEAIQKVIADNAGSMRLCVAESARKGETVDGRMDVQVTIAATGKVRRVKVGPARMAHSIIGKCAVRRIRGWVFPRFNGEPVTVEYPYVLQTSAF
jgi:hypothetical protein